MRHEKTVTITHVVRAGETFLISTGDSDTYDPIGLFRALETFIPEAERRLLDPDQYPSWDQVVARWMADRKIECVPTRELLIGEFSPCQEWFIGSVSR